MNSLDLVAALMTNEILDDLQKSNYLVVTFRSSGALFVVNKGGDNFEYILIFDPEKMEKKNNLRLISKLPASRNLVLSLEGIRILESSVLQEVY